VEGPGAALFESIIASLGRLPLIAEDLGVITPAVEELRDRFGFPGMRVLQFGLMSDSPTDHHLPHNYVRNCLVYTGTHDNDTTVGWFRSLGKSDPYSEAGDRARRRVLSYLGTSGEEIHWDLIRLALGSVANTAIIPMQDVLGLGPEARMNTPGSKAGNWSWRVKADVLTPHISERLGDLASIYGRA
jgi:4-alpha-glucanotransferase